MAVLAPAINTQRISRVSGVIGKGVVDAGKSIRNIGQVVFRNTKVKREAYAQTKLIRDRRVEYTRRKQLEDELEAPDVVSRGGASQLAQADSSKGFFQKLLGFVGYLTAGWLMKNLPQWIAWGKEFIGRVQRAGEIAGGFLQNMIKLFAGSFNILGSLAQNVASFDFFDTSKRVRRAMDDLNSTVGSMTSQIEEAFSLVTKPFSQQPEQVQQDAYADQAPGAYASAGLTGEAQRRIGNDAAFLGEVKRVSQKYGIKEGDLLGLIASESGFNPAAGEIGDHVGLIQFSASSAKSVGTSQAALKRMSRAEQMKYVDKYFENWNLKKGASAGQLYATVFAPAYASGDPNKVLYSSPSREYRSNAPLDSNGDGKITVAEMGGRIERKKKEFGISDNISFTAQPTVVNAGPVQQSTGTSETGTGFNPSGAKDVYGRPVVLSRSAAEAFSAMMRDSKGVVKGSDVASSQRSLEKNKKIGGAVRSLHLSGLALDIHGASNSWMRKYGAKYGWYANDYSGTHGGHFEFRGGGSSTPPQPAAQIASAASPQAISPSITPDTRAQDLIIALAQQSDSAPTQSSGGGGGITSKQVSESTMLNNFIKNKLLLDLAYL